MDLHLDWCMGGLARLRGFGEKSLSPLTHAVSQASGKILVLIACLVLAWVTSEWADRQTLAEIQTKNLPSRLTLTTFLQYAGYIELDESQIHRLNLKNHFPLISEKSPLFWKTETLDWIVYLHPMSSEQLREMIVYTRLTSPDKPPGADQWTAIYSSPEQLEWPSFLENFLLQTPKVTDFSMKRSKNAKFSSSTSNWHHPRELKY